MFDLQKLRELTWIISKKKCIYIYIYSAAHNNKY